MKKKILSIALLGLVLSIASCSKKAEGDASATAVDSTAIEVPAPETTADTTASAAPAAATVYKDGETVEVSGVVKEINKGKDGYTAKVETADGKKYGATISIPNMTDPKQYRSVNVGDKITVKGEVTNLEAEAIIVVRELK
ncbi:hypothetical protein R1T16_06895 [Flavobacterium sp. DG1-102-2]|uniref:OB-fold protein n=1 Tax=Flavobacterium sp. DG1-102-2 TaxID=3081663 RepID=UPI002949D958|nr:hypothetical protein [Flavobacterium sp. DG1-102-2]MDV6168146.1 hypothetical protein [Flavobacterium sp. DG1-102-2]